MSLRRVGETLTDPATGAVLMQTKIELGVVTHHGGRAEDRHRQLPAAIPGDPA